MFKNIYISYKNIGLSYIQSINELTHFSSREPGERPFPERLLNQSIKIN